LVPLFFLPPDNLDQLKKGSLSAPRKVRKPGRRTRKVGNSSGKVVRILLKKYCHEVYIVGRGGGTVRGSNNLKGGGWALQASQPCTPVFGTGPKKAQGFNVVCVSRFRASFELKLSKGGSVHVLGGGAR